MQSQLEAALLGQSSVNTNTTVDEDDNNFQEEENEDVEDFIDEESEDNGQKVSKQSPKDCNTLTRTVTLQNLLSAGILEPGPGYMTIEYLGQRFVGDLLEDGKIKSQETDIVFASPSAWAIACKRFINPDKKSGCGWASVKYRGKKLDAYKNIWYKKKKEEERMEVEGTSSEAVATTAVQTNVTANVVYQKVVVKHNTIANRTLTHDANTMIECVPFTNLGKIQPFLVSLSTNAALLMDFHCHLTRSEVSGYLAGSWDVNSHNLQVTHAFPCRNTKSDRENAPQVEAEIARTIEKEQLTLVGWYHSHPFAAAAPTLRDVDAQLDYQIKMKGASDSSYTPCIGIIISPYNYENTSLESSIIAYWVIPPPETKPNEYGRPMLMSYSVVQDALLAPQLKDEISKCVDYYKKEADFINFNDRYINNSSYIDKLKSTLIAKFPRDENETVLWQFIREELGCPPEEKENLISIPTVTKSTPVTPVSTSSAPMVLPTDISGLLFNSGKFPSASSLLGLPDPMAHSTLAANNMFLSTNLFKMQELLKPLSTSSPIQKSKESPLKIPTEPLKMLGDLKLPNELKTPSELKIPSDIKVPADIKNLKPSDFTMDILNLRNKMEIPPPPDLHSLSKITDYISSLKNMSFSTDKFTLPDLSASSSKQSDFSLNLSAKDHPPAKVAKMDYSLDLSMARSSGSIDTPTDLTINDSGSQMDEDKPLNLAGN